MKRILALLLATTMLFGMTACATDPTPTETQGSTTVQPSETDPNGTTSTEAEASQATDSQPATTLATESPTTEAPATEASTTEPPATETPATQPQHIHRYSEQVTAPTCTEGGYTTYTCSCGHSYKGNETVATGHSYSETVTPPTNTTSGYTTYTCACGHSYTGNETPPTTPELTGEELKNALSAVIRDYTHEVAHTRLGSLYDDDYQAFNPAFVAMYLAYTQDFRAYEFDTNATFESMGGWAIPLTLLQSTAQDVLGFTYNFTELPAGTISEASHSVTCYDATQQTVIVWKDGHLSFDTMLVHYEKLERNVYKCIYLKTRYGGGQEELYDAGEMTLRRLENGAWRIIDCAKHEYTRTEVSAVTCKDYGVYRYTFACGAVYEFMDPNFRETHSYNEEFRCTACGLGYFGGSPLRFELNNEGAYYIVSCTSDGDTVLTFEIPKLFNNLPVLKVAPLKNPELVSITIPVSITEIGSNAFSECTKLRNIYYLGTMAQWEAIVKGENWNYNTPAYTVYCADGIIQKEA